ncbi:MAG: hypothetical protein FJ276_06895 [Planctomycetes bacterium]|nr:hypothetical protein [Planctomycetota bacterium]
MTDFRILALAIVLFASQPFPAQAADSPLPAWAMGPFVKQDKPVLSPTSDSTFDCPIEKKSVRWEQQNVYNPAAVVRDGKVYLLYRADDGPKPTAWGRTCRIGLAWSDDGRHFTRLGKPVLYPDEDPCKPHEWEGGCEDLHIIEGEDGTYYMNYTAWTGQRDSMLVASSRDLIHWKKHGSAFAKLAPDRVWGTRSGVVLGRREGDRLVAAKFNGKYLMYVSMPCWLAESDNLLDWKPVEGGIAVWPHGRPGTWNGGAHEAGAVALNRADGILIMYNGCNAGDPAYPGRSWLLGQALLDGSDGKTVLHESDRPFLYSELDWELKGFTDAATVANTLVPFRGQWLLYYGAADRHIGLAVGSSDR